MEPTSPILIGPVAAAVSPGLAAGAPSFLQADEPTRQTISGKKTARRMGSSVGGKESLLKILVTLDQQACRTPIASVALRVHVSAHPCGRRQPGAPDAALLGVRGGWLPGAD